MEQQYTLATLTMGRVEMERIEAFEMWLWRRLAKWRWN